MNWKSFTGAATLSVCLAASASAQAPSKQMPTARPRRSGQDHPDGPGPAAPGKSYPTTQAPAAPGKSYPTTQAPAAPGKTMPTTQAPAAPGKSYPTTQAPAAPAKSYPTTQARRSGEELSDGAGRRSLEDRADRPGYCSREVGSGSPAGRGTSPRRLRPPPYCDGRGSSRLLPHPAARPASRECPNVPNVPGTRPRA